MVDIIGVETSGFNLLGSQILGQLVDNGADDFQMGQFLGTDIGQKAAHFLAGHGVALAEITHGSGQLSVGAAELADN